MKVAKFGGTSLADANQIKKVCDIILSDPERKIIVVSAPGKRTKDDIKVTDLLIAVATAFLEKGSAEAEIALVAARYEQIAEDLNIAEQFKGVVTQNLNKLLKKTYEQPEDAVNALKAAGEDNNARLVAAYLSSIGHPAVYVNPDDAGLVLKETKSGVHVRSVSLINLAKLKDYKEIVIFPGFFGYTKTKKIVTFSRGGSDITGSILAAAVEADVYENFTDVDSVFAANPSIIENPKAIPEFTYREMRELAYMGFSVLHEDTLEFVYHAKIPVNIKNTNNPSAKGTFIRPERADGGLITGIASANNFVSINMTKYMMNREIGFGRKVLQILEDEDISFEHMPSGIDDMSVIMRNTRFNPETTERILNKIKSECEVDTIDFDDDLAVIIIVGEGMKQHVGVTARSASALAKAKVNIKMINQGSSEISMMFGVSKTDEKRAVQAIYNEFFE